MRRGLLSELMIRSESEILSNKMKDASVKFQSLKKRVDILHPFLNKININVIKDKGIG